MRELDVRLEADKSHQNIKIKKLNLKKTSKGGNCDALQLEGRPTWRQSF